MLDRVVAEAALPLWKVGKYRQAVNDAATSLNQFAQQQLGRRDLSDKKLMEEAFSDKLPSPARHGCGATGWGGPWRASILSKTALGRSAAALFRQSAIRPII
jgi:Protein of unknown function (Hypoth_ymh)